MGSAWFELVSSALKTSYEANQKISEKDYRGMYKVLRKASSNSVLSEQKLQMDFIKPFCFFREAIMLTERCSSPKKINLNKKIETLPMSGVGINETERSEVSFSPTACHEPVRASGWRGERSEPSLGYTLSADSDVKWLPGWDSNLRPIG